MRAACVNLHAAVVQILDPPSDTQQIGRLFREITIADALHASRDQQYASLLWVSLLCGHVFLDYYVLKINPELALIFDLDGVVIDSMPTHTLAWERYLERNGIDPSNIEARMHGKRNDDLVRDLFGDHLSADEVFEHGAAKERLFREMIGAAIEEKLVPGVKDFVAEASKKVPLALGTNAEPANVEFTLIGAGILKYFRVMVDGSQVKRPKPFPDVYLRCAELLKVDTANCIVFEDSPVGIRAARAAGMRVAGITTHARRLDEIDIAVPDFLNTELEGWLSAQLSAAKSR